MTSSANSELPSTTPGMFRVVAGSDPARNGAWAGHGGLEAAMAASAKLPLPGVLAQVTIGDWDDLFNTIKDRLRIVVGQGLAASAAPLAQHSAAWVHDSVLECVAAMEQLHTALGHERGRRQQLELEVVDARTQLVQLHAELMHSRSDERRSRSRALHDSLTALPNRSFFGEFLDHALVQAEPQRQELAVLYLDLDGFKAINDTHGHDIGDQLLRIIAARLTRAVRAEDMVSRLGGDEFACLLTHLPGRERLSELAAALLDAVAAPVRIGTVEVTVRASIGIAICPEDGTSAEALLKSADAAMYHAKRQQSGHAFFDQCADA